MNKLILFVFISYLLGFSDSKKHHKSLSSMIIPELGSVPISFKSDYYDREDEQSDGRNFGFKIKEKHKTEPIDFFGNMDSTFDPFTNKGFALSEGSRPEYIDSSSSLDPNNDIIFGEFKFSSIILPRPPGFRGLDLGKKPLKRYVPDDVPEYYDPSASFDPRNDLVYDPGFKFKPGAFPFKTKNENPNFPFAPVYSFDLDFDMPTESTEGAPVSSLASYFSDPNHNHYFDDEIKAGSEGDVGKINQKDSFFDGLQQATTTMFDNPFLMLPRILGRKPYRSNFYV